MASDGLRTIGIAYKDMVPKGTAKNENEIEYEGEIDWENEEEIRMQMTAISIMGIQDPVRPEVSSFLITLNIQFPRSRLPLTSANGRESQ